MIYTDVHGYPVTKEMDGGDSAVRMGLLGVFNDPISGKIEDYVKDGIVVRHKYQNPWNNPRNTTKDQIKCLVAGLYAQGKTEICKKILEAHQKRLYFCQNFERDFPGTVKYPWPHYVRDFHKLDENGSSIEFLKSELRCFDFADPFLPNDILFLQIAAGMKKEDIPYYDFKMFWHRQALKSHANSSHNEENQMFCECYVLGTLEEYKKINTQLESRSFAYWFTRGELEYHSKMMSMLGVQDWE